GIITFILFLFVGGLYLVNNNLKKLADEKRGLPPAPHIPWYRNKYWIALLTLRLVAHRSRHRARAPAGLPAATAHLFLSSCPCRTQPDQLPVLSWWRLG